MSKSWYTRTPPPIRRGVLGRQLGHASRALWNGTCVLIRRDEETQGLAPFLSALWLSSPDTARRRLDLGVTNKCLCLSPPVFGARVLLQKQELRWQHAFVLYLCLHTTMNWFTSYQRALSQSHTAFLTLFVPATVLIYTKIWTKFGHQW